MIKSIKNLAACILALVYAGSLFAQTAIKSVNQAGDVTYSDKATTDAVSSKEMQIEAGPTETQMEEAKLRANTIQEQADQAKAERDALSKKREAERKAAAERNAAQSSQTIVIENESGYPVYNPPTGSRPPVAIPPGTGDSQHPIYTPPGNTPPLARPLPSPK